jgi:hypothetical protein
MRNPSSALDWIGATAKSPSAVNPKSKNLLILRPFRVLDEIGTASDSPPRVESGFARCVQKTDAKPVIVQCCEVLDWPRHEIGLHVMLFMSP